MLSKETIPTSLTSSGEQTPPPKLATGPGRPPDTPRILLTPREFLMMVVVIVLLVVVCAGLLYLLTAGAAKASVLLAGKLMLGAMKVT